MSIGNRIEKPSLLMMLTRFMWLGLGLAGMWLPLAAGGSCREAQLCCNGRDSSCVVQKAPINAIIEDLSDKPCYCDHACLKLGDCCNDFKDHCGVLDCQVGDWGAWSECDKSCGPGMMTRTRQTLQAAQNGGKHCPTLQQKRACQGYRCHGHRDKTILREMALLLPAGLTHNRHAGNESGDNRRNLRTRYRDSYKHSREHDYCVEFEVIKSSKACHKLPPYNLMMEGDRITVRCDLEALIQDKVTSTSNKQSSSHTTTTTTTTSTHRTYLMNNNNEEGERAESSSEQGNDENADEQDEEEEEEEPEETEEDDAQNMLETEPEAETGMGMGMSSSESFEYKRSQRQSAHRPRSSSSSSSMSKRSTNGNGNGNAVPISPLALQQQQMLSYHCRGEGLSGRTTRWSALPAPSCRGKWLRLTIGPPKKCNHAQFIFV